MMPLSIGRRDRRFFLRHGIIRMLTAVAPFLFLAVVWGGGASFVYSMDSRGASDEPAVTVRDGNLDLFVPQTGTVTVTVGAGGEGGGGGGGGGRGSGKTFNVPALLERLSADVGMSTGVAGGNGLLGVVPNAHRVQLTTPPGGTAELRFGGAPTNPNAAAAYIRASHTPAQSGPGAMDEQVSLSIGTSMPTSASSSTTDGTTGGTPAAPLREPARDRLYISADGKVGVGVPKPAYRLDVRGNVRLTGTLVSTGLRLRNNGNNDAGGGPGPEGANTDIDVIETLAELRREVAQLRREVENKEGKLHPSCQAIVDAAKAQQGLPQSQMPTSGYFNIVPNSIDQHGNSEVMRVYCSIDSATGKAWMRVGTGGNAWNWEGETQAEPTITLITPAELVALSAYGFTEWRTECDISLYAHADDSSAPHRAVFHDLEALKKGGGGDSKTTQREWVMNYGRDDTRMYNRASTCIPDPRLAVPSNGGNKGCLPDKIQGDDSPDCTSVFCTGDWERKTSCGKEGKPGWNTAFRDVVYTHLEFRPQSGEAKNNQLHRIDFTFTGTKYFLYVR